MSQHPESLDHMLATWNERDPKRVRAHLDQALSPEVVFIDPSVVTRGIDEFEAIVHEVHGRLPGADYHRASGIDRHHDVVRYAWEIRRDGELILPGFDATELDEEGCVLRVLGFFGPLPDSSPARGESLSASQPNDFAMGVSSCIGPHPGNAPAVGLLRNVGLYK